MGEDYIHHWDGLGRNDEVTNISTNRYLLFYVYMIYRKNNLCKFDSGFFLPDRTVLASTKFFSGRLHLRCQKSGMQRSQLLRWGRGLSDDVDSMDFCMWTTGLYLWEDGTSWTTQMLQASYQRWKLNGRELFQLFLLELSVVLSCDSSRAVGWPEHFEKELST